MNNKRDPCDPPPPGSAPAPCAAELFISIFHSFEA